jgi:hypothetical protein
MESLYPPGKQPIPTWDAGAVPEDVPDKAHDLVLPAGPKP